MSDLLDRKGVCQFGSERSELQYEGKNLPICSYLWEKATRAASYERLLKEERRTSSKGTYYKDPSLEIAGVEYDSTSESEDEEVCVAELVQGKHFQ